MATIGEIFRTFGPEYIERFGNSMPQEHRKVIDAIIHCRTDHYGMVVYDCPECGEAHIVFRSCGNRHCPACQNHKTGQWLERQLDRQLPGHHFMITFTVPEELRRFIRANQRICYAALFKASSETLKKLAADEKYIGGDFPGFFGVLHTWGRQLHYHPYIHYIVPGGALSREEGIWHPSRIDFFLPVRAMSKIFKAKFRDEIKKNGLLKTIDPRVWKLEWNVNCQAVGSSQRSLRYLAPYVFKVAISDHRIIKVEDCRVFFKYKKTSSNRLRTMALDVMEFLRRFLQHVLPTGFIKVRYYGFLNPVASVSLREIRTLIAATCGCEIKLPRPKRESTAVVTCPHCGGRLEFRCSVLPFMIPKAGVD